MSNHYFLKESGSQGSSTHPIIQAVKNFIGKLRQNPDIYPIRYYKKNRRFRRNWHGK